MERQNRWRMQFSIRNLVMAFTALAVAWHVFQGHYRPYRLVNDLRDCGAEVEFDRENLSWFIRCLRNVLPESSVLTVKAVRFTSSKKPFDYSRLRQLKLLKELELLIETSSEDGLVRDQDFAFLDHLQHLHSLEIFRSSVNPALMEAIVCHRSLEIVSFIGCDFEQLGKPPETEKGSNSRLQTITIARSLGGPNLVEWLNQFSGLRELSFSNASLADDEVFRLAPSPKLKLFHYYDQSRFTPDQQQALQDKFPNARLDVWVEDGNISFPMRFRPYEGILEEL